MLGGVLSMSTSTCCVPNCPKTNRILHKFPKPDKIRAWKTLVFKIWLYRARNEILEDESAIPDILRTYRICGDHFSDFCKLPPCNKLKRGSLPTLLLPYFTEESNEINSQIVELQRCADAKEIILFGGYRPKIDLYKQTQTSLEITNLEMEDYLENTNLQQIENTIPQIKETPQLQKPYFKSVKVFLTTAKCLSEVCRICFCTIQNNNLVKLYKDTEGPENDSQKVRDMLKEILPGLDLEIYENSVICTKCKDMLTASFELKVAWEATEKKLQKIIENEVKGQNKLNASLILVAGAAMDKKKIKPLTHTDHNYSCENNIPVKIYPPKRQEPEIATPSTRGEVHRFEIPPPRPEVKSFVVTPPRAEVKSFETTSSKPEVKTSVVIPPRPEVKSFEPTLSRPEVKSSVVTAPRPEVMSSDTTFLKPEANSFKVPTPIKDPIERQYEGSLLYAQLTRRRNELDGGPGPALCELCGQLLKDKSTLKKHKYRHQRRLEKQNEQQRESMCESCGEIFSSVPELKKHAQRKHRPIVKKPPKIFRYQCEICDKVLVNKHSLQTHIRHIHLNLYNYVQCHLCGKQLSSRGALNAHLRIHTAQKKFSCEICGKKFFGLTGLKKHLLRHNDTKVECEVCGKTVKYESTLRQHIKIFHMNEGSFNCEFCGKPYWKKYDLIRHKIKIHGWGPERTTEQG